MNSLSWMLYLADVAGNARGIAVAAIVIGGVISAVSTIIYFCAKADTEDEIATTARGVLRPALAAMAIGSVMAVFAPSSGTVYAIAASEMGETALSSETGGKAVQALNAWLDRQIEGKPEQ